MQGQCNFFTHYFTSKQPKTIERFLTETKRLYGVLDEQVLPLVCCMQGSKAQAHRS